MTSDCRGDAWYSSIISELLADEAVDREAAAAAKQHAHAHDEQGERVVFGRALEHPGPAHVGPAEGDVAELDHEQQRDRAREKPESKQGAAEELEAADGH